MQLQALIASLKDVFITIISRDQNEAISATVTLTLIQLISEISGKLTCRNITVGNDTNYHLHIHNQPLSYEWLQMFHWIDQLAKHNNNILRAVSSKIFQLRFMIDEHSSEYRESMKSICIDCCAILGIIDKVWYFWQYLLQFFDGRIIHRYNSCTIIFRPQE